MRVLSVFVSILNPNHIIYNNNDLYVLVSILNPKSYVISTTNTWYRTHPAVKNLTRRVKHVLNNIVDYRVSYGRGVK